MKNPYAKLLLKLSAVCLILVLLCRVDYDDTTVIAGETAGILVSDKKLSDIGSLIKKEEPEPEQVLIPVDEDNQTDEEAERQSPGDEGRTEDEQENNPDTEDNVIETALEGENRDSEQPSDNAIDSSEIYSENEGDKPNEAGTDIPNQETESQENTEAVNNDSDREDSDGDKTKQEEASATVNEQEPQEEDTKVVIDESIFEGLSELDAAELRASLDEEYRSTPEYFNALLVTDSEHYNPAVVAEAMSIPTDSNDARYKFITGSGFKAYTTADLPSGFNSSSAATKQMVTFDVPVWKMSSSGRKYSSVWSITIHKRLAASVRCIFSDIYQLDIKFPFNYLKGFMYRKVGGSGLMASKLMSAHSFGVAIDINYWDEDNDYYLGRGNDLRNKDNPYCIPDEVIDVFAKYGWYWGGNFDICADTMHFQYFGLEFLQYDSDEPFPILSAETPNMNEQYVLNLTQRLVRLGFLEAETIEFTPEVDIAVRMFQESYGLETDGVVNYRTWEPLINATHDMSYVF